MKKMVVVLAAVLVASSMSACVDSKDTAAPAATSPPTTTSAVATPVTSSPSPSTAPSPSKSHPTPTKSPGPIYTDANSGTVINFSKGYPKIVRVSQISPRVDTDTYFEGEKKAVQLAPGVWTNLSEGAELQDAVADGGLIGLCASIKAFERKNPQLSRGGTCW